MIRRKARDYGVKPFTSSMTMASKSKIYKDKRNLLTRNVVKVVTYLQAIMDDDYTPEHVKPRLVACLELLDRGMIGLPMKDERVVVEVSGGVARVAFATDYVRVKIKDLDLTFEE
jgi:hypothetical protein